MDSVDTRLSYQRNNRFNIKLFVGDEPTGWVEKDPMARYRVDESKFPNPTPKAKRSTITDEQKALVDFINAETAKEIANSK